MKVYKLTVMVLDFDDVGEEIRSLIEDARYPNHAISPTVVEMESRELGEWHDSHPLNQSATSKEEFRRLFSQRGTP